MNRKNQTPYRTLLNLLLCVLLLLGMFPPGYAEDVATEEAVSADEAAETEPDVRNEC